MSGMLSLPGYEKIDGWLGNRNDGHGHILKQTKQSDDNLSDR